MGFARFDSLDAMLMAEQCLSITDLVCPVACAVAVICCRYSATAQGLTGRGWMPFLSQCSFHFSKA
eukprot:2070967-Rhodomonas_salina.1